MNYEIKCTISVNIDESELNINRLIKVVHEFSKQILGVEFLKMIIEAIDKSILKSVRAKNPNRYENRGYQNRQIQTSMGKINLRF